MVLLDALCATTHRYLDEHPHLQLKDLLITVEMYQRLTTQIVNSRTLRPGTKTWMPRRDAL